MNKLTVKQRRFIEYYCGNATQAAAQAGYSSKTAYSQGQRLLKNVEVAKEIAERYKVEDATLIADRRERQRFWTQLMRDASLSFHERAKASELLAKSEGDFLNKHEIKNLPQGIVTFAWQD